jgi:hypothetical protein
MNTSNNQFKPEQLQSILPRTTYYDNCKLTIDNNQIGMLAAASLKELYQLILKQQKVIAKRKALIEKTIELFKKKGFSITSIS